ncbi:hypothetical protein FACS1894205_6010 [Alphaproteobacteria bacterium]|nr:hypothetical protein FACS1894205_6010 [Alphaproteobacteria bacterium]
MTTTEIPETAPDWVVLGDSLTVEAHYALSAPDGGGPEHASRCYAQAIEAFIRAREKGSSEPDLWIRAASCLYALSSMDRTRTEPVGRVILAGLEGNPKRAGGDDNYWQILAGVAAMLARASDDAKERHALIARAKAALNHARDSQSGEVFHPDILLDLLTLEGETARSADERAKKYQEADSLYDAFKSMIDPADPIQAQQFHYVWASSFMDRADVETDEGARRLWLAKASTALDEGWGRPWPGMIRARMAALMGDAAGFARALDAVGEEFCDRTAVLRAAAEIFARDESARGLWGDPLLKAVLNRRV